MRKPALWVDNGAHLLHFGGRAFPCDRDIEALAPWNSHALLLSSDTDCLSLWDSDGLIRTARVGVYPQDMAVQGDTAYICGGADGRLHLLHLPDLHESADYLLPGMVERVCLHGDSAHLLTLLADHEVQTVLLTLDLPTGKYAEVAQFPGLPGAIAADESELWVGVSEQVLHFPAGSAEANVKIEGVGLARRIEVLADGVLVVDGLEDKNVFIRRMPPSTP